jgi:hypothetical protein
MPIDVSIALLFVVLLVSLTSLGVMMWLFAFDR